MYLANSGSVQFLLADFAGVADHVSHHAVLRIQAALRLNQHQLRKKIVVRIHKRQVGRRQLVLDHDRHVLGLTAGAPHARRQVRIVQIQALRDRTQMLFLGGLARQQSG